MLSYKDHSCAVQVLSTIMAIKNRSLRQKHFKNICRPIKSLSVLLSQSTWAPQHLKISNVLVLKDKSTALSLFWKGNLRQRLK